MRTLDELTALELDVLKEIANIGAGNATTALSSILSERIDMKVPNVEFLKFNELAEAIGGAENLVTGILFTLERDMDGMMMFVMDKQSACTVVNKLMGRPAQDIEEFSEMDLSALSEIGNIIAGSYLSAISGFTTLSIGASIPYLSIDMAGAILSVPAIEFGKISDHVLLIESKFGDDETKVDGYFILIPTLEAFDKVMHTLGLTD